MAEDRNLLERAQNYLTSGRFDKDARYVLGPHLSSGIQGLINLFGPQADIQAMVDEARHAGRSFRKGDPLGGVTSLVASAAAPFLMGTPGSVSNVTTGFRTSRGKNPSTYTWDGKSTQRIRRSPDEHSDKTTATQPKSGRTIFLDKKTAKIVTKYFNSLGEDISLVPISKNTARIIRNKDYGPKKAGVVAEFEFSPQPDLGLHPFEMGSSTSPPGKDMRFYSITNESGEKVLGGQHMGTPITKLLTKKGSGKEDVASFSSAKQKKDLGALPEDIKYGSALSLQKPLITKGRGDNEIAADIIKRGIGRSEGGVLINTPNEKAVLELVLNRSEIRDEYINKVELRKELIKKIKELTKKIDDLDESDKIISDPKLRYAGGSVMERNPYNYQPKAI